ncbi:hypothetical protein GSU3508 [Geobacter sulfurreducens PCA]|uniref:Uncharacterized protein n=1 Tax=Geobacter sulfurreducens (strain ATCC 51573 / DSM 12127 / PCA) TaxID=243231 RepID=I7FK70_GEOSL|nr:hypothetical protein KN400_3424 [Geobacter sulfurreducens KN400]AFP20411.1 hypothetical protein GSU3508 [Geobacter sulfurreducens PCA]HBB69560.1 hypothetical protein [Geobacter sulfurreducens]HCD96865.1 hypothetical protein [Geobacter sulfurreducens]
MSRRAFRGMYHHFPPTSLQYTKQPRPYRVAPDGRGRVRAQAIRDIWSVCMPRRLHCRPAVFILNLCRYYEIDFPPEI